MNSLHNHQSKSMIK